MEKHIETIEEKIDRQTKETFKFYRESLDYIPDDILEILLFERGYILKNIDEF